LIRLHICYLLFVLFLFCAKITHADNSKRVDSLEQALVSTKEDTSQINILNASYLAMHRAIEQLSVVPHALLIDGNRFITYNTITHHCIIKGDAKFMSIAAGSILAKTYRDDHMDVLHGQHPKYGWNSNKGYPTAM